MSLADYLGDVPKEKFSQTMNKLLNNCFLLKKYGDTVTDYRFVVANRGLFEDVLDILGYELIVRDDQGVITINNPSGTGRIHFSKLESILLLIIRLIYIEKMKEASQVDEVIIILEEIFEKYAMLQLPRLRKELMLSALRKYKRMNLIKNFGRLDSLDAGIRIQIYPSIMFAVTASSLDESYQLAQAKLLEYMDGGEIDESGSDSYEDLD